MPMTEAIPAFVSIVPARGIRVRVRESARTAVELNVVAYGITVDGRLHPLLADEKGRLTCIDSELMDVERLVDAATGGALEENSETFHLPPESCA